MEDKEKAIEEKKEEKEVMKETVWSSCSQRDVRNKDLTEEPLHSFVKYLTKKVLDISVLLLHL